LRDLNVSPVTRSEELLRLSSAGWDAAAVGPVLEGVRFARSGSDAADVDYPDDGLSALGLDGGTGYWFDHRAHVVDRLLSAGAPPGAARAMWDVGAGTGSMTARLADAGYEVVAVEPLAEGARAIARLGVAPVFCASFDQLQLPSGALALVGLFDVIEHLAEPRPLLAEVRRVLEPGGRVVVTVPALQSLWSDEDEVAGHHRRYRRAELDAFMRSCGFDVVRSVYLFAPLVVPAALLRALPYRMGRRRSAHDVLETTAAQLAPSPRVDAAVAWLLAQELRVSRRVAIPIGLSVAGVYRVPEAA
jgi:SAM-dependent methyltransferase